MLRGVMPFGFGVGSRRSAGAACVAALSSVMLLASAHQAAAQDPVFPVPRRPLGQELPVYQPAPGDPERREAPSIQNPNGTVSLRDAVALALLQNPGLAAFAWETRAREAHMLQAARPPN